MPRILETVSVHEWQRPLQHDKYRRMAILLSENFRALFYAPFYAAEATGAFKAAGVEVVLKPSPNPASAVRALLAGGRGLLWGGPLRGDSTPLPAPASRPLC